jgi:hypothetical protein
MEFRDFLEDPDDAIPVRKRIEAYRRSHPEIVAEVEAMCTGKTPPYWAGKGRKALMEEMWPDNPGLLKLYKFLSWDSHHVMTAVVDVSMGDENEESTLKFSHRQTPDESAGFHATMAHQMLGDAWSVVAPSLKLRAWEGPPS